MTKIQLQNRYIDHNTSKEGKIPIAEIHPQMIRSLGLVSEIAKLKGYEPLNWIKPEFTGGLVAYSCSAALRHILSFIEGENYNREHYPKGHDKGGLPVELVALHLEHAAYDLLMASIQIRNKRIDLDDRKLTGK